LSDWAVKDFVVHFNEDGSERVEIAAAPGFAMNIEMYSPGLDSVDVAVDQACAEELVRVLLLAIEAAKPRSLENL
jgi:hypothetical protein